MIYQTMNQSSKPIQLRMIYQRVNQSSQPIQLRMIYQTVSQTSQIQGANAKHVQPESALAGHKSMHVGIFVTPAELVPTHVMLMNPRNLSISPKQNYKPNQVTTYG